MTNPPPVPVDEPPVPVDESPVPVDESPAPADESPAPADESPAPVDEDLPTWDDVPSNHPDGATNPPIPVLVVSTAGDCYKRWQSPFAGRQGLSFEPHIEDCETAEIPCGTQIQCTPEAEALKASQPK